jgi:primosomal protein N' (replication factor Y) (superfamily II helicase)
MIADVAFDAPVDHPFSYLVPEAWTLAVGQRVLAPLRGASRVGVVVGLRPGPGDGLKPLAGIVDSGPLLSAAAIDLARWIASESLTSLGSVCLALLPPPTAPARASRGPRSSAGATITVASQHTSAPVASSSDSGADAGRSLLLVGPSRGARLLELVTQDDRPTLVLTGDVESASRWAPRLERIGPVVRLDSGASDADRSAAWSALVTRRARFAVGTRSALLAPLPAGARLALLDEQDPAHRPPGHPRAHARDVALERAAREGLQAVFTAATPSVEMWWRAEQGDARVLAAPPAPWPAMTVADTRGIARREALTPTLARAIRETLVAGRRVYLVVSRSSSALGCDECGAILRCAECAIALAYSPAGRTLSCRLCGASAALPETCSACHGRRLMPFGWGAERVEHAVRRRFARARIARYDPEAGGRRGQDQREAAQTADVVIGPRGALRLFGPASLGLAGFVSPDQMLGVPDFRAAERSFALLWAAAERVRPDGALIVQSQNPTHYALEAVARQDLGAFYGPELKFRAELGYPPVKRIAIITVTGPSAATAEGTAATVAAALRRSSELTVYPPTPDRRNRSRRIVVKGGSDLPRMLADGLREFRGPRGTGRRGIIDVEVDPVEWPY